MRTGSFKRSYAELTALTDSALAWTSVAMLVAALLLMPLAAGNYTLTHRHRRDGRDRRRGRA